MKLNEYGSFGWGSSEDMIKSIIHLTNDLQKRNQERIAKMTPEELEEYNRQIDIHNENIRIREYIAKHECPNNDGGRLVRGKKEKNNDFKRPYTCNMCGSKWYRERL